MAKIPEKIDKYQIEELVARGGMGAVYKGIHPTLMRPIILKKLTLRGNPTVTERFRREARILMDFRNDHIVDVQDHFVQGRSHYIVMEYVDGLSVKDLLDKQRYLDNYTTAYIILFTAKALRYAHSKGVIHRDIKPGNILISKDGDIKLADFGIASTGDTEADADNLTTDGTTLGTPAYMAPEQFENSRTVDYRADLYSLGVMMYEMLCGQRPFPGGFTPETIRMIQKGKFKKLRAVNPSVSPALHRIVNSLIKPRPKSRCGDIDTIIRKLETYLSRFKDDDVQCRLSAIVRDQTPPPVRPKKRPRLRLYITAGAALLVLAGIGTGFCRLTGIHNRLLKPSEFGQIEFLTESDIMPQTALFIDDGADIPAADLNIIYFRRGGLHRSLPAVLKAGEYRAKTTIGENIIWSTFTVSPWSETASVKTVRPGSPKLKVHQLEITNDVYDAISGWNLAGSALLEVYTEGGFSPVTDITLSSGGVHHFKITAPGYKSREFVLRIKAEQRALHFQTELIPEKNSEENK